MKHYTRNRLSPALALFAWFMPVCALALPAGCDESGKPRQRIVEPTPTPLVAAPLWRADTIAERASLEGGMNVRVSGYGIVVGLGKNGSDTTGIPPQILDYLREYLQKQGMGWIRYGTGKVTPGMILRDPDTAVVQVTATVPAMAPVGTSYDLIVQALPKTQTVSLGGGYLMPTDLFLAPGGMVVPAGASKKLAEARGQVFVNPYLDFKNPGDQPRFREGRILNGGVVVKSAPVRLVLRRPDFGLCQVIQERINTRFRSRSGPVANATNAQIIDLTIPPEHRRNYVHFLDVILHLPLMAGPDVCEARAREIALAMDAPGANFEELALVWEAMDRPILPIVKTLYGSPNAMASFYAARTGLRLGDAEAMEVIVHFARDPRSPLRIAAIEEIGQNPKVFRGTEDLHDLASDPSEPVRVAAYEAMIFRGEHSEIERTDLGHFCLDAVKSTQKHMIYATQSGLPKIVLLGADIPMQKEIYFTSSDEEVMVNSSGWDSDLTVVRKIPGTGRFSPPFHVSRNVGALVRLLGAKPNMNDKGNATGLGLTYGQVVTVLSGMCKQHDIQASFVLQQPSGSRKIDETDTAVRPDLPEKSNAVSGPDMPKK